MADETNRTHKTDHPQQPVINPLFVPDLVGAIRLQPPSVNVVAQISLQHFIARIDALAAMADLTLKAGERALKDVRAMLVRAFADVKALGPEAAEQEVRELEDGRRYLQDVY